MTKVLTDIHFAVRIFHFIKMNIYIIFKVAW